MKSITVSKINGVFPYRGEDRINDMSQATHSGIECEQPNGENIVIMLPCKENDKCENTYLLIDAIM